MNRRSHPTRTESRRTRRRPGCMWFLLGLLALVVASAGSSGLATAVPTGSSATTTDLKAFMTLYGYVDNSPPGADIAHPCIHEQAGGTGTYADPITFATDVDELPWCTVIYVPYMERYFIHEDECSQCDSDWTTLHLYRFDMWAGGDSASRQKPERSALLRCEGTWTRADSTSDPNNPTIEVDPPSNLPVVTDPIFTPPTTCWHPITLADPGSQTTVLHDGPVSLPVTAVDTSPGQSLAYRAVGLPNGLSIGAGSGLITGTPSVRQRASVTVTASDSYNSVSVRFGWIVRPARRTRPRGPA